MSIETMKGRNMRNFLSKYTFRHEEEPTITYKWFEPRPNQHVGLPMLLPFPESSV